MYNFCFEFSVHGVLHQTLYIRLYVFMSGARCGRVVNHGYRYAGDIPLFINGLRRVTASECSGESVIRIPSTYSGWMNTTLVRRNSLLLLSYFSIPPLRSYCQIHFLPISSVHCRISPILLRLKPFPHRFLLDVPIFSVKVPRVSLSLWHITWDQTYLCSFFFSCMADPLSIFNFF